MNTRQLTPRQADIFWLIAKDMLTAAFLIAGLCVVYVGLDIAAELLQRAQGY